MEVCALHGRRQCCLANPQFLEYAATYSASQPALVSSDSSTSESSTTTVVNHPPTEAAPAQEKSGQLTSSAAPITPTSILIKGRKEMDVPRPPPVLRRHSSPTAVSEPLRSPPTPPPPVPTSILNSPSSRPMTGSAVAPPSRRQTLDFASNENAARRDAKAVNASPKPTTPIYPRAKITKLPAKSIAPYTPRSTTASSVKSRVIAPSNAASKVTVTPQPKSRTLTPKPASSMAVKFQATKPIVRKSTSTIKLPNPTNHVHLSRQTDTIPIPFFARLFSSKATYKKRQSDISDIKDVFVIDPELVLPKGMFRALDDSFVGLGRKDSFDDVDIIGEEQHLHHHGLTLKRSRTFNGTIPSWRTNGINAPTATTNDKKNLKLEVENGGIDVDVHLVPSLDHGSTTTPMKRTTIDLRLLPDDNFKSGNHPLIARIHAPEKRAPFHLTARTYALPPPLQPPPPLTNEATSPTPPGSPTPSTPKIKSSVLKQHRRAVTSPASINSIMTPTNHTHHHPASLSTISLSSPSYNTPFSSSSSSKFSSMSSFLDKSNMEVQIPRSYRGPITIHVAVGNLDDHILVSREVKERSVVLREGRFARGCFVGRQEFDGEEEEGEGEEEEEGEVGDGDKKGDEACEICGGDKDESSMMAIMKNGKAMNGSDVLRPSDDASATTITPLRIVKRKPVKPFSLQNSEKDKISTSFSSSMEDTLPLPPPPQSSPPPPPSSPTTTTTTTATTATTTTNSTDSDSPSPIPSTTTTTPNDILTNRPSFLDTDPNLSSNQHIDSNTNNVSGWKLTRNQDLNGRATRRVGLSEQHGMNVGAAPYRSSPLRFSMTSSSSPRLSVTLEEGGRGERGSPFIQGEEGSEEEVENLEMGEGGEGGGRKIVRLEELSSLPSSSEEEEEEEEGEGEEENDGGGTGSGSVNYESAESGSGSGHDLEEPSSNSNIGNQQQQQQQQELIRCTCNHQLQKRVQPKQGKGVVTRKRREWIGDRIDIMIGKGRVKIKYDDEVEEGGKRGGRWFRR